MWRERGGFEADLFADVGSGELADRLAWVGPQEGGELAGVPVQGALAFAFEVEPGDPVGKVLVCGGLFVT